MRTSAVLSTAEPARNAAAQIASFRTKSGGRAGDAGVCACSAVAETVKSTARPMMRIMPKARASVRPLLARRRDRLRMDQAEPSGTGLALERHGVSNMKAERAEEW